MLDEHYRNGELFIAELIKRRDASNYSLSMDEILKRVKITDEFIRENFREPMIEFFGHSNVSGGSTEAQIIGLFRKYFEVSGKTKEILRTSFFNTKMGVCSYCGKETEVFSHVSYIFPLYRKIDSITPSEAKLRFCKRCGFILYSGVAYLYFCTFYI